MCKAQKRPHRKRAKKKSFKMKKAAYHSPKHGEYRLRSLGEKTVEDWLHANNVQHIYEPRSKEYCGFIPDWVTGSMHIVEYFGYWTKAYRKRTIQKVNFYTARYGDKFIALYPEDLDRLDEKLKDVLK